MIDGFVVFHLDKKKICLNNSIFSPKYFHSIQSTFICFYAVIPNDTKFDWMNCGKFGNL